MHGDLTDEEIALNKLVAIMWFVLKKIPANIVLLILNGIILLSVNVYFYLFYFIDLNLNQIIGVI